VVERLVVGLAHLAIRDGAEKLQQPVAGILERSRVHPRCELLNCDGGAEIDTVADEVGLVDTRAVDLDHGPILCVLIRPDAEIEKRGENDVADGAVGCPVAGDVAEKLVESRDRPPGVLLLALDVRPLLLSLLVVLAINHLLPRRELHKTDLLATDL
jgi:hypothetical protein